jgi:hemerythrin-like metal-binding protein
MQLIKWSKAYVLGIDEIDAQHQQLCSLINELYSAMSEGRGKAVTGEVLDSLAEYTIKHFSAEERLMQAHRYAAFGEHQATHKEFVAKVEQFRKRYYAGNLCLNIEILDFLRAWLIGHIQGADRKYAVAFGGAITN